MILVHHPTEKTCTSIPGKTTYAGSWKNHEAHVKRTSSLRLESFTFCLPFFFENVYFDSFLWGCIPHVFFGAEVERLSIRRFGELCETCCDQGVTWILMPFFFSKVECHNLGGGFSYFFYFHPYLGKWSNLTNIFQMDWNHHLVVTECISGYNEEILDRWISTFFCIS